MAGKGETMNRRFISIIAIIVVITALLVAFDLI